MNWLDILLVAVLAFSTIQSFRKGFSREIIGLASALAALVLAMWFYGLAGSSIAPWVSSPRIANLIGFFIVIALVLLAGALVGWIVNRFLRTIGLSFFDRLLGSAFGFVRGVLVATALLTAFIAFGQPAERETVPAAVINSRTAPYVLEASRFFVAIAPMDLKQSFHKHYSRIESALKKPVRRRGGEDF